MEEHKVYHIRECGNEDVMQGYIGVTSNIIKRTRSHKHSKMLNTEREVVILFSGNKEDCYKLEQELRPEEGIGFNKGVGGYKAAGVFKRGHEPWNKNLKGLHLSEETEFKKGMIPHNKGKGKNYIFTKPCGEEVLVTCISDFCKANNLTPSNMRKVAKGERRYHKGWQAREVLTEW